MDNRVQIMDEVAVNRALARITHEIIEHNQGVDNICLLGIKTRGIPIARILKENIQRFEGKDVPCGHLDITMHRDDISLEVKEQKAGDCHFPCDISGMDVIIVDDVLYTGRTARAAMESVFANGRPKTLQFAVLVDRGHRELPIRADYVGKNLPTSASEKVSVTITPNDEETAVYICRNN